MVQKPGRNHAMRGNHQHYARMTHPNPHRHVVPTAVLTRSRLVPLTAARPINTVVPQTKVQHQRPTKHGGNPQHALKDKGVIDSGYSWHMTEKISYLSNFEEINGGYVAFGRNPKGGKITVMDPESAVHVSPSSYEKTKKHDDKTKREAKGKSHVELSTEVRNLSEEFEYFFYNSIN
nr:ribonuclease H-like domain-containing protein [Tanacetum cinerariifolium]